MKVRKKNWTILLLFIFIFLLSACQSNSLAEKETDFSAVKGNYSFQMPANWEELEDYKTVFTQDTVFGAEDTKSLSTMMIRGHKAELFMNEKQLEDFGEETFADYYELEEAEKSTFKVGDFLGLHYRVQSVFDEKDTWLDIYLVSVNNAVIEFQFYSPMDRQTDNRQELFADSVASLKINSPSPKTETESETAEVGEAIAEDYTLKVTSYKTAEVDEQPVLIVRYLSTNQGSEALIPKEEWLLATTVTQDGQQLESLDQGIDTETDYLLSLGKESLSKGKSAESAVLYRLDSAASPVTISFDSSLFLDSKKTSLLLEAN